jgi:hypothetical protein
MRPNTVRLLKSVDESRRDVYKVLDELDIAGREAAERVTEACHSIIHKCQNGNGCRNGNGNGVVNPPA